MQSSYEHPWVLNNEPLESEDIKDYVGMVYLITNKINNKKYIGKKFFWSRRKLPPLKGKTRKRIKIIESNWKDYWGSSTLLSEAIDKHGHVNFDRYVLELCYTKTQCAYYEMKYQIDREAILSEEYYNDFIGGKISGKNLEKL